MIFTSRHKSRRTIRIRGDKWMKCGLSIEVLEERRLLAVTVTDQPDFLVTIDDADNVAIDCNLGQVRVFDDGSPTTYLTPCANVTSLRVLASGNLSNGIATGVVVLGGPGDPSTNGVRDADFTSLTRGSITLDGGGGNDGIVGCEFSESIIGGEGNDNISGGDGRDSIDAGAGNDTINGGIGDDSILAGAGDDTVSGSRGNDILNGGAGIDHLLESLDGNYALNDSSLTSTFGGTDLLSLMEGAILTGGVSANRMDASAWTKGRITLNGSLGDDRLIGSPFADFLFAGAGNDVLTGGRGDDFIHGGGDVDKLIESSDGNFRITESSLDSTFLGADRLIAVNEAVLIGGVSSNRIDASAASFPVTLIGGGGNDVLIGGGNTDLLMGGEGNDKLIGGGFSDVPRSDTLDGGAGTDTGDGGAGTDRCISVENPTSCEV